jgi:hyperosmotically inducible periplasmic protein
MTRFAHEITIIAAAYVLLEVLPLAFASCKENPMSHRIAALLCLTSAVAACSHQSESAKDPSTEQTSVARSEPAMAPASLEASRQREPAELSPTTPNPSRTEGPDDTRAPLIADTKGAGANDFKADPPKSNQPDNTAVNERDRSSAALTPLDQRENKTDLEITQQIRKAVMADGSLSFTAKNVKIITAGGKVTLRGPVKTDAERSAIEAAARQVAGATSVDNQIEVKK